jgi:hypothetical protein
VTPVRTRRPADEYGEKDVKGHGHHPADGCADVAYELHQELTQTRDFLDDLAEVHQAVVAERDQLSDLRTRLAEDRLAENDSLSETVAAGKTDDVGVLVDRVVPGATRPADGDVRLEADV